MMPKYVRTDEVLLDIKDVSLSLGGKLILRGVNAQVTDIEREDQVEGQVITFLGPSGIGKTQLSRIIAGLQVPSQGQVLLKGSTPTKAGSVCMVPQFYPLFDYTTVAGNLVIAGKQKGLDKDALNLKATEYIRAFELEPYLNMYPKSLSGGTRQRVAIARQLMCASNYMVMDEPFSGLDPIMKQRAIEAIVKLAQMDTYNTIIIVTHDIPEGLSVADTVWLMGYEMIDGVAQPGATIVETHDLAQMGLAWQPDIQDNPTFLEFVSHIKHRFQTLK